MSVLQLILVLCVLAAVGCKEKSEPLPADAPASPLASSAAQQAALSNVDARRAVLDKVSVPADFEEQASAQITPRNLDSEIDTLEKELSE